MKTFRSLSILIAAFVAAFAVQIIAHEMTLKGTVVAVEQARVQIKTGKEKQGDQPAWYPIDASTKIKRGKKEVTFAEARIAPEERIVIIVDHPDKGPMRTKEVRLADQ
ncbi:MAG TPA: hypothetical protein VES67_20490 [Vicinamibacterales bacterium]|nr:hypothetical protein [Vicinamibacterales bacterium]